jgi:hypothetical protein
MITVDDRDGVRAVMYVDVLDLAIAEERSRA